MEESNRPIVLHSIKKSEADYKKSASMHKADRMPHQYMMYIAQAGLMNDIIESLTLNENNMMKTSSKPSKGGKVVYGTVVESNNFCYKVQLSDGTNISILHAVMHKISHFPEEMLTGNGSLKEGCTLKLWKNEKGKYYPDFRLYSNKAEGDTTSTGQSMGNPDVLLAEAEPYIPEYDKESLSKALSSAVTTTAPSIREQVFQILLADYDYKAKQARIAQLIDLPVSFEESDKLEKKSSLFYTATDSEFRKEHLGQMMEITQALVAFANSHDGKGTVVIGVKNDNNIVGLQEEIAANYPDMDLDKFESTVLYNFIKQYTEDNVDFMNALTCEWKNIHGKLVLFIHVDYKGYPVTCKGGRLPIRTGRSTTVLTGKGMVQWILSKSSNKVA